MHTCQLVSASCADKPQPLAHSKSRFQAPPVPPNSVVIGYAIQEVLLISTHLSAGIATRCLVLSARSAVKSAKSLNYYRLSKQHSTEART